MGNKTALFELHQNMGGKIVDFGGWDMPLHYGSQIEEHHQVRQHCGMFDVSHMTVIDISGEQAKDYLRYLLANDVAKLTTPGKALYSGMLNNEGGVIDDLIVYYLTDTDYRVVVNCATREKDLAWMQQQAQEFDVTLTEKPELAMIAVQGPEAIEKVISIANAKQVGIIKNLSIFQGADAGSWFIARTGYTGEDGVEMMLPNEEAAQVWQALSDAGVRPIGLGARDTLRLEAGMNLYGSDMDETISPLSANMGWTVTWEPQDRNFIGREALEQQKATGVKDKLVGIVLEGRGVLRDHQTISFDNTDSTGEITSGSFSPTLGHSIAFARVPKDASSDCYVDMRGKPVAVKIVKMPFVRNGKSVYEFL